MTTNPRHREPPLGGVAAIQGRNTERWPWIAALRSQ